MRVRAEAREYVYTDDKQKRRVSRGYALVTEGGKPLFIGLFVDKDKAAAYCRSKGWKFVREEAA